jgi:hypothetical protein
LGQRAHKRRKSAVYLLSSLELGFDQRLGLTLERVGVPEPRAAGRININIPLPSIDLLEQAHFAVGVLIQNDGVLQDLPIGRTPVLQGRCHMLFVIGQQELAQRISEGWRQLETHQIALQGLDVPGDLIASLIRPFEGIAGLIERSLKFRR